MKQTVKIRLLDEVNCVLVGLANDHIIHFYEKYARMAPNYFFNPKFKLGAWDGKIRYFHKTGKTYTYLLDGIIPELRKLGYDITIDDLRVGNFVVPTKINENYFAHIIDSESGNPILLRPYQVNAINSAFDDGTGIIIAGTGAGKTIMNGVIVDAFACANPGLKTITVVPSTDLIRQTVDQFVALELDVGEYSGDRKDFKHTHVVSTWQSLQNNPKILKEFHLIVVDECHGARGNVLQKLLNEHGSHIPFRIGLTGTLPKEAADALAVLVTIGPVRYTIPAHILIEQGWLAKLDIGIVSLEEDLTKEYEEFLKENEQLFATMPKEKPTYTKFKDSYFPDYKAEKSYLQSNKDRIEWIAEYLSTLRDMNKGNVFCLVDGVRFGQKLAAAIPNAIFVHGKDKAKARKEIYDLFSKHDDLIVIATVHIASTGLNIKRIFNLVFIDVGKSFIRVIQTIGRGLRKAKDKDSVNVTDITSDLKYGKKHVRERIKFYNEAKYPHKKTIINYTKEL